VRRRTEGIARPAVGCLNRVYRETRSGPSVEIAVLRFVLLTHWDAGLCAEARYPRLPLMHTADVASIVSLIGRVRGLSRPGSQGGAPGERQQDEKGTEVLPPVHRLSFRPPEQRPLCATHRLCQARSLFLMWPTREPTGQATVSGRVQHERGFGFAGPSLSHCGPCLGAEDTLGLAKSLASSGKTVHDRGGLSSLASRACARSRGNKMPPLR
jgi:hypothetical protein